MADRLHNPDFAAYAELCGASRDPRSSADEDSTTRCAAALAHHGPALVGVHTDPDLV